MISQEKIDKYISNKDKYHEDGHATEKEACECFKQYQLDHHLRFSKQLNQQHKCKICEEYTEGLAYVGEYECFSLCEKHQNRESVEQIYQVGESWQS